MGLLYWGPPPPQPGFAPLRPHGPRHSNGAEPTRPSGRPGTRRRKHILAEAHAGADRATVATTV
eukprot:3282484-Lingulodinium_polyedra.AAC.1